MDDTRRPGSIARTSSTTSTSKPNSAPSSRSTSGLPAPPRPKRKSRPTSTVRTPRASDEHVLDELARGQVRELLVEAEHERRVDAGLGEQLQLLVHADEVLGADLGPQQRERVAVEGDRDDAGAAGRGIHSRTVDHRAVAGVHAVELADRDDRRAVARGHLGRIAEDDHGATAAAAASVAVDGSAGRWVISHHSPKNGSTSGTKR